MSESAQQVMHELTSAGLLASDEITQFDEEVNRGVDALLQRLVEEERITHYQAAKFKEGKSSDIYFGDYIVLQELGRGGMGTVLLARHRRMDREVAIKVLPASALDSEPAIARFYQEVKVAARLNHPNIVHAYDAGENHGMHYLVMEYVPGHDLAKVLEQLGPIPTNLAIDYLTQAATGLEYAHRKGIVHRDIKPSNLLLDNEGTIKVLDMGLARIGRGVGAGEASMHLTTTGQVMGTVEYMSPEQAEDTRLADERSDIYSLGCTLYRLVTGVAPFSRDTVVKTILAHREAPIPTIDLESSPELAELNGIFHRMVAKQPTDRYQSMAELLQAIRQYQNVSLPPGQSSSAVTNLLLGESSSVSAELPTQQLSGGEIPGSGQIDSPADMPMAELVQPLSRHDSPRTDGSRSGYQSASQSVGGAAPPGQPLSQPSHSQYFIGGVKPHRGALLLLMAILSVLFAFPCYIGVILGVITWVYAHHDLSEMRSGHRDSSGETLTNAARVLAIISCSIGGLYLVISLFQLF